jgi:phosphoglycerate dehydrogenase-like enzyme
MSRPRIGVVVPRVARGPLFTEAAWRRLESLGDVVAYEGSAPATAEEAARLLAYCEIGVGSWNTVNPGTPGLVARLPRLRLWVHAAGSVKAMVTPEVAARGITVASCAPAIAQEVAEFVVGEIIVGLRRVIPNAMANRCSRAPGEGRPMPASTIGIVDASHVGWAVLELLRNFGGRRLVYDPFVSADAAAALGAEKVDDLNELCRRSQAVSLHTPDLPATRHMMSTAQFQAMPDDAVFINTARGACVDEAALIAELSKGRLFAFLDVSDPEPAPSESPLRRLPNVVYTSHIAGGRSPRVGDQAVDDIEAFLAGRPPKLAVTPDMLDSIA